MNQAPESLNTFGYLPVDALGVGIAGLVLGVVAFWGDWKNKTDWSEEDIEQFATELAFREKYRWASLFYEFYQERKDDPDFADEYKKTLRNLLFKEDPQMRIAASWLISQEDFLSKQSPLLMNVRREGIHVEPINHEHNHAVGTG